MSTHFLHPFLERISGRGAVSQVYRSWIQLGWHTRELRVEGVYKSQFHYNNGSFTSSTLRRHEVRETTGGAQLFKIFRKQQIVRFLVFNDVLFAKPVKVIDTSEGHETYNLLKQGSSRFLMLELTDAVLNTE